MKLAKPYPYLYRDIDARKRERWRLRAPGKPTVTIKGKFGSPEFAANYRAAMEGESVVPTFIAKHGTFDALGRTYLRSAGFSQLARDTERKRRSLVETFIAKYGKLPVTGLRRDHVKTVMESYAGTPGTARNFLSMLRVLIALAIEDGIRDDDPTIGIKRPKLESRRLALLGGCRDRAIRGAASGRITGPSRPRHRRLYGATRFRSCRHGQATRPRWQDLASPNKRRALVFGCRCIAT